MKNIPIPSNNKYLFILTQRTEHFIKRLRWKAHFFLKENIHDNPHQDDNKFKIKTHLCPPPLEETKDFESDLWDLVENIKFRKFNDPFQCKLSSDVRKIKASNKIIVAGDKTTNFYEMPVDVYNRTLTNNITKTYKKCTDDLTNEINIEAKSIALKLNLEKKLNTIAEQQSFITIKDHKNDFLTNPKYRLINPTKSEIGKLSKQILDNINNIIRNKTKSNQWISSNTVINWFTKIPNKNECTFIIFDIVEYYPSISKNLLLKAINYAKNYTTITDDEIEIILHARRTILFHNGEAWVKRNGDGSCEVAQGSYDGAEASELVGLFLLSLIHTVIEKNDVGLYRDDGLAILRNVNGSQCERLRKKLINIFKYNGLKIETSISKVANFLDLKFDLNSGSFKTYNKPNNQPLYVHSKSNHPPYILAQIPKSISKRISDNSSDIEIFKDSAPFYDNLLANSGYTEKLNYIPRNPDRKINRKRDILWFNPPFSKSVQSNIGRKFLKLIDKHFGNKDHKLNKIFNRNKIKLSYCCMDNMEKTIKSHNKRILSKTHTTDTKCNCQKKDKCPLDGNCNVKNVIYEAQVTLLSNNHEPRNTPNTTPNHNGMTTRRTRTRNIPEHNQTTRTQNTNPYDIAINPTPPGKVSYIGAAEDFKARYRNHLKSLNNIRYETDTELSKYIWKLKLSNKNYSIKWKILKKSPAFNKNTKSCNLCTNEKLEIIKFKNKNKLLNKRNELVSKCRHGNKFTLANLADP